MTTPATRPDGAPLAIGTTFAGYRIEELAGRQRGMGKVYVATHVESERRLEFPPWPVALKVFTPPRAAAAAFCQRFEELGRRQAQLHHPNLVSIYEVGTEPSPFISMTLFRGPNLADLIASGGLDDAMVLSVMSSVAEGLEAGYGWGFVYRRLRPSSVLVATDPGRAFLGDFGAGRSASTTDLIEGEQLGTFVDYISPEEARGAEVDRAGNVYSLASIAFECLTGEPPYPRQEGPQALKARLEQEPRSLRVLRPELPQGVDTVLKRALDRDAGRRYSSPAAFIAALTKVYPKRARKGRRHDAVTAIAAAAGAAPASDGDAQTATVEQPGPDKGAQAATAERGAARRRRLSPALLLLVPLVVLAAVLGAVAAPSQEPEPSASRPRQLDSDGLGLRYPANWRPTRNAPEVPGLGLADPVALAAPAEGRAGRGVLVAGRIPAGGEELLPDAFLQMLPGRPERDTVDLGAVQAYRYRDLRLAALDREAHLYVVLTDGDTVVVGCLASPEAKSFPARCERVASTLTLSGDTALALAPSPSYARSLQRTMAALNRARRDGRRRLATARTRSGQAGAATRLARSYRAARSSASRLTAPPGARAAHAEIVRTLGAADAAQRRLAAAARTRDRGRWSSAAAGVRSAEAAVQRSVANLRGLGYDPKPPS